jgi:hypothetical protein
MDLFHTSFRSGFIECLELPRKCGCNPREAAAIARGIKEALIFV